MNSLIQFLQSHGYALLFGFVVAEQLGLPIPAAPVLLAAGALVGQGHLSSLSALVLAAAGAVMSDCVWYQLGRVRGGKVLKLLCRLSLEPDSCVRQTEDTFARYGLRSLLVAKFVPGFSTAAPPLAGLSRIALWRFLLWDAAGSLLWAGSFLTVGYLFSNELERIAQVASRMGSWCLLLLVGGLAAYVGWKYDQRRRFMKSLRVARVTPLDLKVRLDAGEPVTIVDLRHSQQFAADAFTLPGAIRMDPSELERLPLQIPRDQAIVLYCS